MTDIVINYAGRDVRFCDLDASVVVDRHLLESYWWELPNLEFIRDLQVRGDYADVGAYIGTHALYFSLFCPSAVVHAFEPSRTAAARLRRNLEMNHIENCVVHQVALVGQEATMFVADDGQVCETATLDSFHLKDVRVMKIDVEAQDLNVLRGAHETLRSVDHLFVEIWSANTCAERHIADPRGQIIDLLAEHGFTLRIQLPLEDLYYFARTLENSI
jgi:precorrin-6B methylase 2